MSDDDSCRDLRTFSKTVVGRPYGLNTSYTMAEACVGDSLMIFRVSFTVARYDSLHNGD